MAVYSSLSSSSAGYSRCTCRLPFACDRRTRERQQHCDFLFGQTAEVAKLNDFDLTRINAASSPRAWSSSRISQSVRRCRANLIVQGDFRAGTRALRGVMASGVIDQDAPHHLRGNAEKLRAVLPTDSVLSHQPDCTLHGPELSAEAYDRDARSVDTRQPSVAARDTRAAPDLRPPERLLFPTLGANDSPHRTQATYLSLRLSEGYGIELYALAPRPVNR